MEKGEDSKKGQEGQDQHNHCRAKPPGPLSLSSAAVASIAPPILLRAIRIVVVAAGLSSGVIDGGRVCILTRILVVILVLAAAAAGAIAVPLLDLSDKSRATNIAE